MNVYDAASKLYNKLPEIYLDECKEFSDAKTKG